MLVCSCDAVVWVVVLLWRVLLLDVCARLVTSRPRVIRRHSTAAGCLSSQANSTCQVPYSSTEVYTSFWWVFCAYSLVCNGELLKVPFNWQESVVPYKTSTAVMDWSPGSLMMKRKLGRRQVRWTLTALPSSDVNGTVWLVVACLRVNLVGYLTVS